MSRTASFFSHTGTATTGRRRRATRIAVTAAVLATTTVLAACGSSSDATTGGSKDSIVIGMFQPIAASGSGYGVSTVAGAQLAIDKVNATGGIDGRKLQLETQDNLCTAADGVTAVQKLLSESPNPVALVGGLCSGSTVAALPIVQRAQVPLLVDWASDPEITAKAGVGGNPWVFRWAPSDTTSATETADYLAGQPQIKKVAVVVSNDSFGLGGKGVLVPALQAKGIQVVSQDVVDLSSADFPSIVARIKAGHPDAVAVWLTGVPQVKSFYDQYGLAGLATTALAGQIDMTQPAIKQYNLTGYNTAAYATTINTPGNTEFLAAWKAAGKNEDTAYLGWDGYESIQVLAAALRAAQTITRAGVRDALKNLEYGPTILGGTIKFDANNQAHDSVVMQHFTGADVHTTVFGK